MTRTRNDCIECWYRSRTANTRRCAVCNGSRASGEQVPLTAAQRTTLLELYTLGVPVTVLVRRFVLSRRQIRKVLQDVNSP